MKLNTKRTVLVGLGFFSISAFWQAYDNIIPLILRDTFSLGDTLAGFIMSLDNILALFMLPLFGALSDKANRRIPFIIFGTIAAVGCTVLIPFAARSRSLTLFFIVLGALLVAMGTYRSPAVALMPDITPKPLRSKANAIINLMGALGGAYTLLANTMLLKQSSDGAAPDYLPVFLAVAALMAAAVLVLTLTINEKKLVKEMQEINYGVDPTEEIKLTEKDEKGNLPPDVRRSLFLILASVSFWFMGYNAVTTAFTKYAATVWGQHVGQASTCLLVATVGAMAAFIPIGILSSKIGRKKTVLIGVTLLCACFASGALVAERFTPALYIMFALVGFAWAAINVNSYPMVVEISKFGNIGRYTGYYYTFSMAAQIVTPILSGALLEHVGYHTLFPYASIMVALSFFTMSLTRHGDNRPALPQTKIEAFDVQD